MAKDHKQHYENLTIAEFRTLNMLIDTLLRDGDLVKTLKIYNGELYDSNPGIHQAITVARGSIEALQTLLGNYNKVSNRIAEPKKITFVD